MINNIIKPIILLTIVFINVNQFKMYYNNYLKQNNILYKVLLAGVCVAIMLSVYYITIGLVIQAKIIILEVGGK